MCSIRMTGFSPCWRSGPRPGRSGPLRGARAMGPRQGLGRPPGAVAPRAPRPGKDPITPQAVQARAPAALPSRAAVTGEAPRARPNRKPALKASPAPVVSRTGTRKAGTVCSSPARPSKRHPRSPCLRTIQRSRGASWRPERGSGPNKRSASASFRSRISTSRRASRTAWGAIRHAGSPGSRAHRRPAAAACCNRVSAAPRSGLSSRRA
jgi:hypothetical protein